MFNNINIPRMVQETAAQKAAKAAKAALAAKNKAAKEAGGYRMSDGNWYLPTEVEKNENGEIVVIGKPGLKGQNADGSAVRPDAIQVVDQNGNLKAGMAAEFSKIDPNQLEGYNMLKTMAQSQGPTSVANAELDMAKQMQSQGLDQANAQTAGAAAQARSQMQMRGGMNSGARQNMGREAMKMNLQARQGVNQGFAGQAAQINASDANRKIDLMRQFGQAEGDLANRNNDIGNNQVEFNKQLQGMGIQAANGYRMDAYTAELDKWGAGKQAQAQRESSGGGGGGCCFIFLEARYGNGTMDAVVRRFRDENMNPINKRGYYKVSEVLVPLMRKSKLVKLIVRLTLTDPLVAYGKAYYGEGTKLGFIFAPVKNFWLKTFEYLGQDHEFVRENGETV